MRDMEIAGDSPGGLAMGLMRLLESVPYRFDGRLDGRTTVSSG